MEGGAIERGSPEKAPRSRAKRRRRERIGLGLSASFVVALLTLVGCGGCSPTYVLRSAWEEGRILLGRAPIEEVLERPEVDADVRVKLELVLEVRRFAAARLGLDVGGAYSAYSEVPPGALLHVVSAAEQTRLVPYTWWFPIVGSVTYKGFFEEADARAAAAALKEEGYDTWVRGTVAFSTLGWFDDPVLSSWMRSDEIQLADLVIHELLHRTIYVSGKTAFNESFASFVGHRGAIAFFAARDGPDADTTRRAEEAWRTAQETSRKWEDAVARLKRLYADARRERWPREKTLARRAEVFAELGPADRVNNAVILAQLAYQQHFDRFEQAFERSGGDLGKTIEWVGEVSGDSDEPFAALADALASPPVRHAARP
jgi:predicted aminopeptidase